MSKILWFDVETTGLDPAKDSIHQMAGIVEVNGEKKEEFNINIRPKGILDFPDDYVTPVGGITKAQLLGYQRPDEAFKQLTDIFAKYVDRYNKADKFFMGGYNCQGFDTSFLRVFFDRNSNPYYGSWFWSSTIDVMILATDKMQEVRSSMPDFKLASVAKCFGVVGSGGGEKNYHDAMFDINVTRDIYHIIQIW